MENYKSGDYLGAKPPIIVTNFDSDESETETDHEEASDTEDTFSVEELENALFTELEDGGRERERQRQRLGLHISLSGPDNVEISEPDSETSSDKDFSLGQDGYEEEAELEVGATEKPSELLIPITLDNGDVLMPKFSELDDLVPPKWSIFYRSCSGSERKERKPGNQHLANSSNPVSRFFIL